ncbi:hypothetical protein FMEAI12_3770009 [Parafrankia sp. Ea1.12]|nr:hypothetical protein FMEAI12_3770009 [Parafrankia sp. Ea1.12]
MKSGGGPVFSMIGAALRTIFIGLLDKASTGRFVGLGGTRFWRFKAADSRILAGGFAVLFGATSLIFSTAVQPAFADPESEVRKHAPAQVRDACVPTEDEIKKIYPQASASILCPTLDTATPQWVTYSLYESPERMNGDKAKVVEGFDLSEVKEVATLCENENGRGRYASYSIENQLAGEVICLNSEGDAYFTWTDQRYNITSTTIVPIGDSAAVLKWWNSDASGPVG